MRRCTGSPFSSDGGWSVMPGDRYLVTGTDVHGRRFRWWCATWPQCKGINLFRGSRWLLRDGKRYLIDRVYN
jgi:hypothetical protein